MKKDTRKETTLKKGIESKKKTVDGLFGEFKKFISRGNVIDLAVGVIIGGAFGKIVTSLVNDIIMPAVGIIIGGQNFEGLTVTIGEAVIKYGAFIQNIVDFLIVAFCIFIFVKVVNKLTKTKEEEKKPEPPVKPDDVKILEEIRDLLKKQK